MNLKLNFFAFSDMFVSRTVSATRLGIRRRAETNETSLARKKYATGAPFVYPSPGLQNKHWEKSSNENNDKRQPARYRSEKIGHRENPIKDFLLPKPTRWQVEWTKYMKKKIAVERAAGEEAVPRYDQVNWDWEQEITCFQHRLGMEGCISKNDFLDLLGHTGNVDNTAASRGREFCEFYLKSVLTEIMPKVPESGIIAMVDTILNRRYIEYQMTHTAFTESWLMSFYLKF